MKKSRGNILHQIRLAHQLGPVWEKHCLPLGPEPGKSYRLMTKYAEAAATPRTPGASIKYFPRGR